MSQQAVYTCTACHTVRTTALASHRFPEGWYHVELQITTRHARVSGLRDGLDLCADCARQLPEEETGPLDLRLETLLARTLEAAYARHAYPTAVQARRPS